MAKAADALAPTQHPASAGSNVYARVKAGILSNTYRAGAHIYESDLAETLGVSRTPVREALVRLEAEGLVACEPRKGARVLSVSADDMREIYDVLLALEAMSAGQLAKEAPGAERLSDLSQAIAEMESAYDRHDLEAWAQGDDRFHRALLRLNGNARVVAITDLLYSQAHRTQMITLRMREDLVASNEEHRTILGAIEKGDATAARDSMYAHRSRGGSEIARILETYGLPPL